MISNIIKMPSPSDSTSVQPWNRDLSRPLRSWTAYGNDETTPKFLGEENQKIAAMIILQDCNIAGQYYRYFWYLDVHNERDKRYCDVSRNWYLSSGFAVTSLEPNSVVTIPMINQTFQVHATEHSPFVVLLLPVQTN
jgi:hypothetical protein